MPAGLTVVGIGADGWAGLAPPGREALAAAGTIFGSARQLGMLPDHLTATRVTWPAPLLPALPGLLAAPEQATTRDPATAHPRAGAVPDAGSRVVLASGDPTLHGIATTIGRLLPDVPLVVVPHPSSVSLACARLGWPQQDVAVLSLVGRPVELLHPAVQPGRRVLLLAGDASSPTAVATLLCERGFGPSQVVALSSLGAGDEQRAGGTALDWAAGGWPAGARPQALTVVAVECLPGPDAIRLSTVPGLPDDAYENDGQLTKRHVRAVTLSSLAPGAGELLWDVGGGAGSIAIEWMRHHPACRAISVERDAGRADRIRRNAAALGVPGLDVVTGSAPRALAGLPAPDAVFVGGGAGTPGLLETCRRALRPGGRLVVNVTTVESELVVLAGHAEHGGELARIGITRAAAVGRYTGWRPAMPVTQWVWQARAT